MLGIIFTAAALQSLCYIVSTVHTQLPHLMTRHWHQHDIMICTNMKARLTAKDQWTGHCTSTIQNCKFCSWQSWLTNCLGRCHNILFLSLTPSSPPVSWLTWLSQSSVLKGSFSQCWQLSGEWHISVQHVEPTIIWGYSDQWSWHYWSVTPMCLECAKMSQLMCQYN